MKRITIFIIAAILFPNFAHALGIEGETIDPETICCTWENNMSASEAILNGATCICTADRPDKGDLYAHHPCATCYEIYGCPTGTCQSSSSNWTNGNKGYQQRTVCNAYTGCVNRTEYRCAANYYGQSTDGATGCTPCPSSEMGLGTGEPQGYSSAGSISITRCFIPQDYEICDSSGCFDTTNDCYYQN